MPKINADSPHIRVQIDPDIKKELLAILQPNGQTISWWFRTQAQRFIREHQAHATQFERTAHASPHLRYYHD